METANIRTHHQRATSLEKRDFSVRSDLPELELSYRLSTGVPQLDEIMQGGYIPQRSYMIPLQVSSGVQVVE